MFSSVLWVEVERACRILGISTAAGRINGIIEQIKYKKHFILLPITLYNCSLQTITACFEMYYEGK